MTAPKGARRRTGLRSEGAKRLSDEGRRWLPSAPGGAKQALHAELIKLRTLPGTGWLLLAVVALTVAVGSVTAAAVACPASGCGQDPAKAILSGIDLSQAVVAILAVLAISGEYSTGLIRVTLTAMPRRITVLTAKAAVLTGLVLVAGTVGVLASVLAERLILPGRGYLVLSLANGADLRATAGSVLYLGL